MRDVALRDYLQKPYFLLYRLFTKIHENWRAFKTLGISSTSAKHTIRYSLVRFVSRMRPNVLLEVGKLRELPLADFAPVGFDA